MSQFSFINGLANLWNNTSIPSRLLSAENQLTFDFQYGLAVDGGTQANCKSVTLIPNQVEIDPNSTIDFSGFYHFARLPDLEALYRERLSVYEVCRLVSDLGADEERCAG